MKKIFLSLLLPFLSSNALYAQIVNGLDTLYGHEWIESGGSYLKIKTARDGIYRITGEQLLALGIPSQQLVGHQMVLWRNGKKEPFYSSTPGPLQSQDYLEFVGRLNRAEVDAYLFEGGEQDLLNPDYSLFSDTAVFFLQYGSPATTPLLYSTENQDPDPGFVLRNHLPYRQRINFGEAPVKLPFRGVIVSHFNAHTGFGSTSLRTREIPVTAPQLSPQAGPAQLQVRLVSSASAANQPPKNLQIQWNGKEILKEGVQGNRVLDYSFSLSPQEVLASNVLRVHGLGSTADRYQVVYVELVYGRETEIGNQGLGWQLDEPGQIHWKLQAASGPVLVYEPQAAKRYALTQEPDNLYHLYHENTQASSLWAQSQDSWQPVESLQPVDLSSLVDTQTDYLMVTHPGFLNSSALQDYVLYRSSAAGGSFRVKVVDVHALYDLYGFGIYAHDLALRSYVHHFAKVNPQLRFVNLVGKGVQFADFRTPQQKQAHWALQGVSSYGFPASDNLLAARSLDMDMLVALGRIPVRDEKGLRNYLQKIVVQEQRLGDYSLPLEQRLAQKRWVHLSGGDPAIQAPIRNYMDNLGRLMEESLLGATTESFYSIAGGINEGTGPVYELINKGAAMVTFFGHSSTNTFDLNISSVNEYRNSEQFPIMLALGCYSGNYHVPVLTIAETLLLLEMRGYIANLASAGLTSPSELNAFARELYREMGQAMDQPYFREILNGVLYKIGKGNLKIAQYMNYLGDPALQMYRPQGPDYTLDYGATQIQPTPLFADRDTAEVSLTLVNLGQAPDKTPLAYTIEREDPLGQRHLVQEGILEMSGVKSKLTFPLAVGGEALVGRNRLLATLLPPQIPAEWPQPYATLNNQLVNNVGEQGYPFAVLGFNAAPVFPYDCALVPDETIKLYARVLSGPSSQRTTLVFELDTTPDFTSLALLREKVPYNSGDLPFWQPPMVPEEGRVYYWRVSQDSLSPQESYVWKRASFVHLKDKTGWSQRHWGQWNPDTLHQMVILPGALDLASEEYNIEVRLSAVDPQIEPPYYSFNQSGAAGSIRPWTNRSSGVFVIVQENRAPSSWTNQATGGGMGLYGSLYANNRDFRCFPYDLATEASRDSLIHLLENIIPEDHMVFLLTLRNTAQDSLLTEHLTRPGPGGLSILDILKKNGAALADQWASSGKAHYGFIYEKGSDYIWDEGISEELEVPLYLQAVYKGYYDNGHFVSASIGPVQQWQGYQWKHQSVDLSREQEASIRLVNSAGETLVQGLNETAQTGLLQEVLEPGQSLRWRYAVKDAVGKRVPALEIMDLYFEAPVDLALYRKEPGKDTLVSGEPMTWVFGLEALGFASFADTVSLRCRVMNSAGILWEQAERLWMESDKGLRYDLTLPTEDWSGALWVEVEANYDQKIAEWEYSNNVVLLSLFVLSDQNPPLLQVRVDGQRILHGDLIATLPLIQITAKDDHPFKLLDDAQLLDLQWKKPGSTQWEPLDVLSQDFVFVPASSGGQQEALWEWRPHFTESGEYGLKLNVKDKEGNTAGNQPMEILFKVITQNAISNLVNYPNPFSDRTRFAYTLTGENIAYQYKLEIYTVSGKLIREIRQEELGPLRVGTHLTDYAWDAKDTYGNRLANGVYLYRLVIRDEKEEEPKHFETAADGYSKNQFSKMVLIK
jgi:hypothetical protein